MDSLVILQRTVTAGEGCPNIPFVTFKPIDFNDSNFSCSLDMGATTGGCINTANPNVSMTTTTHIGNLPAPKPNTAAMTVNITIGTTTNCGKPYFVNGTSIISYDNIFYRNNQALQHICRHVLKQRKLHLPDKCFHHFNNLACYLCFGGISLGFPLARCSFYLNRCSLGADRSGTVGNYHIQVFFFQLFFGPAANGPVLQCKAYNHLIAFVFPGPLENVSRWL